MTALPSKHSSGCHRGRKRQKKQSGKENLEKRIWIAGYKYSWRKMEATAQNRDEDGSERRLVDYSPSNWSDRT